MIPRLIPCNSSPAPDIFNKEKINHAADTLPTPTVSMMMVSKAASQSVMVSRVSSLPPNVSRMSEGRKAFYLLPNSSILVLYLKYFMRNRAAGINKL
jgi:hypothetical protein